MIFESAAILLESNCNIIALFFGKEFNLIPCFCARKICKAEKRLLRIFLADCPKFGPAARTNSSVASRWAQNQIQQVARDATRLDPEGQSRRSTCECFVAFHFIMISLCQVSEVFAESCLKLNEMTLNREVFHNFLTYKNMDVRDWIFQGRLPKITIKGGRSRKRKRKRDKICAAYDPSPGQCQIQCSQKIKNGASLNPMVRALFLKRSRTVFCIIRYPRESGEPSGISPNQRAADKG